jgi:hypothetical protein
MRIVQRSPTMSSARATGQGWVLFEEVTSHIIVTMRTIVEPNRLHCAKIAASLPIYPWIERTGA